MENLNQRYFNLLVQNIGKKSDSISLFCPENNESGNSIPYSIASNDQLADFNVVNYEDIKNISVDSNLEIELNIIKMQAGLGSSVERNDIVKKFAGREFLGAKGTDLFFPIEDDYKSISELQLLQAAALATDPCFKKITYTNLVNDETRDVVNFDWLKVSPSGKIYADLFGDSAILERGEEIFQEKMPTIGEDGELTTERMAPAGHGFVGIFELIRVFKNRQANKISVIGNGEDLNSTPEIPLLKWIYQNNIPVVMITTTKTADDLKGGQISLLKKDSKNYLTIVEKAQAEESGQLAYFEKLGLRENDRKGLFNTNVVVINEKALVNKFNLLGAIKLKDFLGEISPDVISNIKEQNGKKFTQLESALGSVMLNLDRFFRREFNEKLVQIVNVDVSNRENFFIPIKKREDYDILCREFSVSSQNYRLFRQR